MNPVDQTEKNIRAIYEREQAEIQNVPISSKAAHAIAKFAGTFSFAVLNAIFFGGWMLLNVTLARFDPFPFAMLSMFMAIEAIFLSTFVLISQNELSKQADARNKLDLHVNLLAEQESTEMFNVLLEMARKLGVDEEKLKTLKQMTINTDPEEMLEKIAEVESETPK